MSRILLIQADEVRRLHNASVLRTAGHEVHEATQGRASVSLARRLRPDLVVCDIQLPEFNGLDVVTALRRGMMAARTPLLMLLPRADQALVRQAIAAGADDCLSMPMQVHALRDAVAHLLTPVGLADAAAGEQGAQAQARPGSDPQATQEEQAQARMADEINRQWIASEMTSTLDDLGHATFLVTDLFGHHRLSTQGISLDPREVLPRMTQAVESLKLFGAAHVLPFGTDLMAIFPSPGRNRGSRDRLRAVRAAFGLLQAIDGTVDASPDGADMLAAPLGLSDLPTVPGVLPESQSAQAHGTGASAPPTAHEVSVALHCGELYLARLPDGAQQDVHQLMPLGRPLAEAVRIREQAARRGWRFAASEQALRGIDRALMLGRTSTTVSDHGVSSSFEVLALR